MPTGGLEYRYPFLSVQSWGTQVFEPIAQLVASPNETKIGLLPNEDAQTLVFDDTSLFSTNRFSGFDRLEGGVRANAALSYTATLNNGMKGNVLFGESFHLAGLNSFATPDLLYTGLYSGLDKDRSDYVGRVSLQPTKELSFAARFRLDSDTLELHRLEVGASGNFDRFTSAITYASSSAVPTLGNFQDVEYLTSTLSYKLTPEWRISGGLSYDVLKDRIASNSAVLSYKDDCFDVSLTYSALYYTLANQVPSQSVMLTFSLRTLGGSSFKQDFGTTSTSLY
jgi:LPS-assembly protein